MMVTCLDGCSEDGCNLVQNLCSFLFRYGNIICILEIDFIIFFRNNRQNNLRLRYQRYLHISRYIHMSILSLETSRLECGVKNMIVFFIVD
jgi:hypothetical protein